MIFAFEDFELDTAKVELRRAGEPVAVEPQVFALIRFLLANRDRMVAKDEIVAAVWDGRIVSDSAIASRVKSARQALGDDGRAQRLIRTAHGVGFRFVGEVREGAAPALISAVREITAAPEPAPARSARPSIAVLPFRLVGAAGPLAGVAEALPDDLTTELARLRWLFVIARASAFQFAASADLDAVRAALNVRYCLTGAVEVRGEAITVLVELSDAEDRGVVWSDRYRATIGAVHDVRDEIVRAIVGALEFHIPLNEARLARLKPPDRLDAWQAYHLGLTHMYRFNKDDNSAATTLFERAACWSPNSRAPMRACRSRIGRAHFSAMRRMAPRRAAWRMISLRRRWRAIRWTRSPISPWGAPFC